jgi:hypothetical protein
MADELLVPLRVGILMPTHEWQPLLMSRMRYLNSLTLNALLDRMDREHLPSTLSAARRACAYNGRYLPLPPGTYGPRWSKDKLTPAFENVLRAIVTHMPPAVLIDTIFKHESNVTMRFFTITDAGVEPR